MFTLLKQYKKLKVSLLVHSTMKSTMKQPTKGLNSSVSWSQLLTEYGGRSSIHGISYILGRTETICDRLVWLAVFLIAGFVTVLLTIKSYNNWQDSQVVTTLQDMDRVVQGMNYPAVTFCAAGLHTDLVEEALLADYNEWKSGRKGNEEKSLEQFMSEKFEIHDNKLSILDIIQTFVAPDDESIEANIVIQNTNRRGISRWL